MTLTKKEKLLFEIFDRLSLSNKNYDRFNHFLEFLSYLDYDKFLLFYKETSSLRLLTLFTRDLVKA